MSCVYNVGSLFAGVGGVCLGFQNSRVDNKKYNLVWANEMDEYACETYRNNFSHKLIHGDINKVLNPEIIKNQLEEYIKEINNTHNIENEVSDNIIEEQYSNVEKKKIEDLKNEYNYYIRKHEEILNKKIDILLGGFPCQAFSIAGERKGFEDDRGNLFLSIINLINQLQQKYGNDGDDGIEGKPRILFLENVKNLKSHDSGRTYKVIKSELEKIGYIIKEHVLNTMDYSNLPQNRERIYIIGFLNKEDAEKFNLFDNIEYRDPKIFYPWAKEQIQDDEKYYFLLDEVQLLDEFVSVLNGLADKKNCDVFVTGSNAKFLSRDIATEFGGRGDEVHMYPLSFSEFMSCYDGNKYDGWNEYITYGGIPLVVLAETDEQKMILLDNLFQETYISDIVKRNKIRNVGEMESLLDVLASAIGALTNPNKLQKTFKSVNNSKITATTITKYIEYLEDSFLIEEANRYDIKGKSYIGTPLKYYFMDMGLRNSRIHYRQLEVTHSMENVIYNELRMRGFHVDVGNLTVVEKGKDAKPVKKQLEVDFICNKGSKKYYIQSAYMLETEAKMAQEIRPFLKINDSFKKIVITSDIPKPFYNDQGILIMNVYDFLLNVESLKL